MKFNGTIFSKPQQDQLKEVIGKDLEAVVEKINDIDARIRNYTTITFSTNTMSVSDKEKLVEAIKTDPNAIIHIVFNGSEAIIRPIDNSLPYPKIGGVVQGSTPSAIGFIIGSVVPIKSGDLNFNVYSGAVNAGGALAFEQKELHLRDVVFLQ